MNSLKLSTEDQLMEICHHKRKEKVTIIKKTRSEKRNHYNKLLGGGPNVKMYNVAFPDKLIF